MTAGCPNRQRRHTPSSWTTPNPDTTLLGLYFQQPARHGRHNRENFSARSKRCCPAFRPHQVAQACISARRFSSVLELMLSESFILELLGYKASSGGA